MTQTIGFAGKKQSGKNTCCNFIIMLKLIENGVCRKARMNDYGEIEVSDIFGEAIRNQEYFLFKEPMVNTTALLADMNAVKIYGIADTLKNFCVDVLGLERDDVYGTDEDKSKLTQYRWENMPGIVNATGPMTVREVLQYVGTDMFRKMNPNIWINALIKRIDYEKPEIALICDVRFDNEFEILEEKGAIILGLCRDIFNSQDTHASEQVNLDLCHKKINNSNMSIVDQNKAVYMALKELNCKNITDLGV
jgi:hypothetical protein